MPSASKTDGYETWEVPLDLNRARHDLGGMSLSDLAAIPFDDLGRFKQAQSFPHGYSRDYLTFYAPRDPGVHEVLLWALLQAKSWVAINMYGFADPNMVAVLRHHVADPTMMVTLTLDSSQAGGAGEKALLKQLQNDVDGNSIAVGRIAIGRSERGAISHDKLMVVDGLYLISGSTNWSFGGEEKQDNQLTLARDPIACAEARAVIDLNHDIMLKQMAAKAANRRKSSGTAATSSRSRRTAQKPSSGRR